MDTIIRGLDPSTRSAVPEDRTNPEVHSVRTPFRMDELGRLTVLLVGPVSCPVSVSYV
jgi:hypothetical protein